MRQSGVEWSIMEKYQLQLNTYSHDIACKYHYLEVTVMWYIHEIRSLKSPITWYPSYIKCDLLSRGLVRASRP